MRLRPGRRKRRMRAWERWRAENRMGCDGVVGHGCGDASMLAPWLRPCWSTRGGWWMKARRRRERIGGA